MLTFIGLATLGAPVASKRIGALRAAFKAGRAGGFREVTGELFQKFEINRSPWWERLWRICAGSLVIHFIFVAVVLYVPAFREALNIAEAFSNAKYVERDYKKTVIQDRAVLINTRDVFEYPPGYFSTPLTPEQQQAQLAPIIVPTPTPVPVAAAPPQPIRPPRMPRIKPPAAAVASASPVPSPAPSPQATPVDEAAAAGFNENMTKEERDKKLNEIAAKNGIERPDEDAINKKPLKDWLAKAKEAKDKNEINLTGQIEMTIEADRDADGKLLNPVIVSKSGDPKLQEIVKDFVSALSDSQALASLKDIKHIKLSVSLTDKDVTVKVSSEVESADKAIQMAKGYNLLLIGGRFAKKGQTEETIYKNTKVSADGKQVTVNFTMPRKDATEILTKLSTS